MSLVTFTFVSQTTGSACAIPVEMRDRNLARLLLETLQGKEATATQARLSGHCICIDLDPLGFNGGSHASANTTFNRGQVIVNLSDPRELIFVYGCNGAKYIANDEGNCHVVGAVVPSALATLEDLGNSVWLRGAHTVRLNSPD